MTRPIDTGGGSGELFDNNIARWFGKNFMMLIITGGIGYIGTISNNINTRLDKIESTIGTFEKDEALLRRDLEYLKENDVWQDKMLEGHDERIRLLERNHPN